MRRSAGLIAAALLFLRADATIAEPVDCQAELKRQDEQCQGLAEKLAAACPNGTNIKETPRCRDLSAQIANTCTRRPCAPPPRKGKKAKAKAKPKSETPGKSRKPSGS